MKRYVLDIEKLWVAFESKRKSSGRAKLSRERIAARYGIPKGSVSFGVNRNKDLQAKILIPILMYLDRPITDFIKTVEVSDNGNKAKRNKGPADTSPQAAQSGLEVGRVQR